MNKKEVYGGVLSCITASDSLCHQLYCKEWSK